MSIFFINIVNNYVELNKTFNVKNAEQQLFFNIENILDISKSLLSSIVDENIRKLVITLLNSYEEFRQKVDELTKENQSLKDEINRLKGEYGRPDFKSNRKDNKQSISSEQERKQYKQWQKASKKHKIPIDIEQKRDLPKEQLPPDAYLLRYEKYVQQDLKLVRNNTQYLIAVYYSPSLKKTYRASLHEKEKGYFGTGLKTLIHVLTHVCDVTQNKLLQLLHTAGIYISAGSINNILLEQVSMYESEMKDILYAGLSGQYCGMDSTGSNQKGQRLYTQIINNKFFTIFSSRNTKSRLSVLATLQGKEESCLSMCYNKEAKELLHNFSVSQKDIDAIEILFEQEKEYTKLEVEQLVAEQIPTLKAKKNMYSRLLEAMAIGGYHQQKNIPVVNNLITDDAGEYKKIAAQNHALCWVHDARFYIKLTPYIYIHRQILNEFKECYWKYYYKLLDYKINPDPEKAKELNREFDDIFTPETDYFQLNKCIERTYANKPNLLIVLENTFIPLHNNESELSARRVVTKRKINLHTVSDVGTAVKDAAMSVVETAKKLKVNVIDYLHDRISRSFEMPPLANTILLLSG